MRKLSAALFALSVASPVIGLCQTGTSAPVWFTLNAREGDTITATGAITLRFGQVASTCAVGMGPGPCSAGSGTPSPEIWTDPQTFTAGSGTVSLVVAAWSFGNVDPLPGVYKTVQVQEQAAAQNITVNGQPVTVPGLTTTPTCQLVATPNAIALPNTAIGFRYSFPATIVSNCPTTITVTAAQVAGAPFSTSGFVTPFSVAPGQTQNYTALFTPTTTGSATGSITFVSNASNQNLRVSLTGTGVPAQQGLLSSSPTTLSFGNVTVNSTQSKSATITNTGTASVTVSAVTVAGAAFSLGNLTTPFTLRTQQSIPLTVGFAPKTSGSAAGTLTIRSNAQNGTLTVPLAGTAGTAASHSVALSWTGPGSQIAGFNVYRSTVSGGPYSKINGALVVPTNYSDQTVVSGTTYSYTVTAVATNGAESGRSNQTTVAVPTP